MSLSQSRSNSFSNCRILSHETPWHQRMNCPMNWCGGSGRFTCTWCNHVILWINQFKQQHSLLCACIYANVMYVYPHIEKRWDFKICFVCMYQAFIVWWWKWCVHVHKQCIYYSSVKLAITTLGCTCWRRCPPPYLNCWKQSNGTNTRMSHWYVS